MYKLGGAGRWELLELNQRILLKENFIHRAGMEGAVHRHINSYHKWTQEPCNWIPSTSILNFLKVLEYNNPNLQDSPTAEMFWIEVFLNVLLHLVRNVYNWRHKFADCDLFYIQVFYIFYDSKDFLSWFNLKRML